METYGIRTKVLFVLVMARCIGILDLIKLWMYSICPEDWVGDVGRVQPSAILAVCKFLANL